MYMYGVGNKHVHTKMRCINVQTDVLRFSPHVPVDLLSQTRAFQDACSMEAGEAKGHDSRVLINVCLMLIT